MISTAADCSKIFAAQADDCRGFAECQVQRVDVSALHVQQAAHVVVATHFTLDVVCIEQCQVLVAVAFPTVFLLGQAFELLFVQRRKDTARTVITLDVVVLDTLTDDVGAFKHHAAKHFGCLVAVA